MIGVVGARDGTLAIMVGGDGDTFQKAQPILHTMAKTVTHCGDLGAGLAAKIANKYDTIQSSPDAIGLLYALPAFF